MVKTLLGKQEFNLIRIYCIQLLNIQYNIF